MQYLIAAGIVLFFLAVWVGVDTLYRKNGFKDRQGRSTACPDCSCGGSRDEKCDRSEK
ncbi:MAG: hypothetical protein WC799_21395 [Desulfobacteraceae bacterium]|jgi:hypothetical protein